MTKLRLSNLATVLVVKSWETRIWTQRVSLYSPFFHSFSKHLLSSYHVPGTGAGVVNKRAKSPASMGLLFQWEEQTKPNMLNKEYVCFTYLFIYVFKIYIYIFKHTKNKSKWQTTKLNYTLLYLIAIDKWKEKINNIISNTEKWTCYI